MLIDKILYKLILEPIQLKDNLSILITALWWNYLTSVSSTSNGLWAALPPTLHTPPSFTFLCFSPSPVCHYLKSLYPIAFKLGQISLTFVVRRHEHGLDFWIAKGTEFSPQNCKLVRNSEQSPWKEEIVRLEVDKVFFLSREKLFVQNCKWPKSNCNIFQFIFQLQFLALSEINF